MKYNLITLLGPTATGKTSLGAHLATKINGEIISGDSRQVYRRMNLGTGKDYSDYIVSGLTVPYHLIDVADPGEHYNVFRFQQDFIHAFTDITSRGKFPVLCGGSGMYLEAVLSDYRLIQVPPNLHLRDELEGKTLGELTDILKKIKPVLHNITDLENERRAIRAIEIEKYYRENQLTDSGMPALQSLNVGVNFDRITRRKRISERLKQRLDSGMVDEVRNLLDSGLKPEELIYYGLEYKYITQYLTGDLSWQPMFEKLEIAIHQFAKRQMTWFRGMERRNIRIHWLDGEQPLEKKIELILALLNES